MVKFSEIKSPPVRSRGAGSKQKILTANVAISYYSSYVPQNQLLVTSYPEGMKSRGKRVNWESYLLETVRI